jgi:hypothetical protein
VYVTQFTPDIGDLQQETITELQAQQSEATVLNLTPKTETSNHSQYKIPSFSTTQVNNSIISDVV